MSERTRDVEELDSIIDTQVDRIVQLESDLEMSRRIGVELRKRLSIRSDRLGDAVDRIAELETAVRHAKSAVDGRRLLGQEAGHDLDYLHDKMVEALGDE